MHLPCRSLVGFSGQVASGTSEMVISQRSCPFLSHMCSVLHLLTSYMEPKANVIIRLAELETKWLSKSDSLSNLIILNGNSFHSVTWYFVSDYSNLCFLNLIISISFK